MVARLYNGSASNVRMEVREGCLNGSLLGEMVIKPYDGWSDIRIPIRLVDGIHDVCFVFHGVEMQNVKFDNWKFINI